MGQRETGILFHGLLEVPAGLRYLKRLEEIPALEIKMQSLFG